MYACRQSIYLTAIYAKYWTDCYANLDIGVSSYVYVGTLPMTLVINKHTGNLFNDEFQTETGHI